MQTEQRNSLRLLQWMMAASVALPVALFAYASAVSYISTRETADRQVERALDVAHEHALKVFETIDRSLSEINEIVRGIPDAGIKSREEALHLRLKQFADSLPQLKSAWIFDARGNALVNSLVFPAPGIDFSDRDYFKAHVAKDIGTYIGEALTPRPPYQGAAFFGVSRRRHTDDGSFAGVIQASVLPGIFRELLRQDRPRSRQLLRPRSGRRQGAGAFSGARSRYPHRPQRPGRTTDRRPPEGRPHYHDLARRRHRTASRIPAAGRVSDLRQRRTGNLRDPLALARHHRQLPDLWSACHRAAVSDPGAGVAAHAAALFRVGEADRGRGGAQAWPAARGAGTADRRRRARFQQSSHGDPCLGRSVAAAASRRGAAAALYRGDLGHRQPRCKVDGPASGLRATASPQAGTVRRLPQRTRRSAK